MKEGKDKKKEIIMTILIMILINNLLVFTSGFSIIGLTIIGSFGHIVKLEAYNQCWVQR